MPRYRFVDTYEFSYFIDAPDEETARGAAASYDSMADIDDAEWVDTELVLIETPIPERISYGPDLP
jgi:hypothetical protein